MGSKRKRTTEKFWGMAFGCLLTLEEVKRSKRENWRARNKEPKEEGRRGSQTEDGVKIGEGRR
jgi:hypothetical protein